MKKNGFAPILILIVVAGIAALYFFGWNRTNNTARLNLSTPKSLPCPTSESWIEYNNTEYGYSISHPCEWTIDSKYPNFVYVEEYREDSPPLSQTIQIVVYPQKGTLSAYQFVKDVFYAGGNIHDPSLVNTKENLGDTSALTTEWLKLLKTKQVIINGISMTRVDELHNLGGTYGPGYWATHNGDGYFILFATDISEKNKSPEPDQVLSTFKFTR